MKEEEREKKRLDERDRASINSLCFYDCMTLAWAWTL